MLIFSHFLPMSANSATVAPTAAALSSFALPSTTSVAHLPLQMVWPVRLTVVVLLWYGPTRFAVLALYGLLMAMWGTGTKITPLLVVTGGEDELESRTVAFFGGCAAQLNSKAIRGWKGMVDVSIVSAAGAEARLGCQLVEMLPSIAASGNCPGS